MRIGLSVVLLVLALGGAGALAVWGMPRAPGEPGVYHVEAIGPDGTVLDARVHVPDATALRALEAAAQASGIALELERYAGMGTYVRAIGGHAARGASGWVYEIQRDGALMNGDRSAEFFPLEQGDAVRWSWTGG